MSISMTVESTGVNPLQRFEWAVAATGWADRIAPIVRNGMKAEAPVAKGPGGGRLRDSIRYQRKTSTAGLSIQFYTNTPYAAFVVDGTPPHIIRPRAARALHWQTNGNSNFARLVHHPGTKPNPFARKALEELTPMLQATFKDAVIATMNRG